MQRKLFTAALPSLMILGIASEIVLGDGRTTSPLGSWTARSSTVLADGSLEPYTTNLKLTQGSTSGQLSVSMSIDFKSQPPVSVATTGKLAGNVLTFDGLYGGPGIVRALSLESGGGPSNLHGEYTFTQDGSGELLDGSWTYKDMTGHDAQRRLGTGWTESYMGGSPTAEAATFKDLAARVNALQGQIAKDAKDPIQRGFHNKGKGYQAQFKVDAGVAADLQPGFLKAGASFPAILRFSNAGSKNAADATPDERGLAIRVKPGKVSHLLSGASADAQDFLTTNSPVTAPDPVQFLDVAQGLAGLQSFDPSALNAFFKQYGLKEGLYATYKVAEHTDFAKESYTDEKIWSSRAPIKWGSIAVKFQLTPADGQSISADVTNALNHLSELGNGSDPNHLSDNLDKRLAQGPVALDFAIQRFQDEKSTPIEDASVEWKTPVEKIGQLVISKIEGDEATAAAQKLAAEIEKMAFNPWNCTEDFRPLGSIMRARKVVYAASAGNRGACPFGFGQ